MQHDELELLKSIHESVLESQRATTEGFEKINGRLRKSEVNVAVLNWAVFVGGASGMGALAYLFLRHMAL